MDPPTEPVYQLTPFMFLYAFVFSIALALCVYAVMRYLRHDRRPEIVAFAALMAAISSWELVNFLVDAVTAAQLKLLGKNVVNAVAYPVLIYATVAFSLAYTDNERWIGWVAVACAVHVAGTSAALFVEPELLYESHGLVTKGPISVAGFSFEQFVALDRTLEPAFFLYWAHGFLFGLAAGAILVRHLFANRRDLVPARTSALLIGVGAPLSASVLLVAGVVSPAWNPTDVSFGVTAVAFGFAIFRYRLFRLVPVGRRQLVRIMDDPVVLIDDDDRVVDSNPTARDLFGVGSDWRGTTAATFFGPLAERVARSRDTDDADAETLVERDGDDRYFDPKTTPVRTPAGEVGGRLIVLRDITELVESRQKVQRQNERLDQFASIVSHDLRNPLTVAIGYLDLLDADYDGDDDYVERINGSLDRMETIIADTLTLARQGGTVDETTRIDGRALLEDCWAMAETGAASLKPVDDFTIRGDRDRLRQVFENLFRNSVEHGPPDVTVRVGVAGSDTVYIADDGPGIPPARRADVFEPGHTSAAGGTGFGLSIVRRIAEAHEWTVRATESDAGGARIEFAGVDVDRQTSVERTGQ